MKVLLKTFLLSLFILTTSLTYAMSVNGYWQNFNNPAETPVRLTTIPSGYSIVHIAFAEIASDGKVSFHLEGPPYPSMNNGQQLFKEDIKTLQARGVKVLLSLGGQNGVFTVNDSTQAEKFYTSLKEIINEYQFNGIDYDFENGLNNNNINYLIDITRKLKADFAAQQKNLIFTLAPETIDVYWQVFPNGKYDKLIQSGLIDYIQVQLYNSGCMAGSKLDSACYSQGTTDFIVSQVDSTIQTWQKNGLVNAAQKYVIGLPASPQAAGGGFTQPSTVKKAINCLNSLTECASYIPTQIYPKLGGLMTWSINWDAKNGYEFEKEYKFGKITQN